MNLKIIKRIITIACCILVVFSLVYYVFAEDKFANPSQIIKSSFGGDVSETGIKTAASASTKIISTILSIIRTVSAGIAIVVLIVIACKYILASAGDRADIKKYAVNYVIGALILFAASAIVEIVKQAVDSSLSNV